MSLDFEKLADTFRVGSRFMNDDERLVLSAAIETVLLEKQAGHLPSDLDENEIVLVGAAIADELLKE
jgi:hypothetical protein